MTDADLIAKKLAFVETCLQELRTLARPERIEHDVRERRFVEHTLQVAIQAVLNVASHVVSDERLGEPATNRDLFVALDRGGWLPPDLAQRLEAAAGFRNLLVHAYGDVDLAILRDVAEHRIDDLGAFVAVVRARLLG